MRILLLTLLALSAGLVAAPLHADWRDTLADALADERRSDQEKARDANRKPLQTLEFFKFDDSMTVLELIPGGGWYTKLLAPVLRANGKLYLALGTDGAQSLLGEAPLDKVSVLDVETSMTRDAGLLTIAPFDLGINDVDLAVTFRNLHNFSAVGRDAMNRAVFTALKPGGLYGVVDHTRRHMESDNPENRRRADPVLMIKEIQAAGFELVDFSTLHFRADDELRFEVGRRSVAGNTDRFTLLFQKPLD